MESKGFGVEAQLYGVGPYQGGAPGTNIGFVTHVSEWIPFVHEAKGSEKVTLKYSTHTPDPTKACVVAASVVFEANGRAPDDAMKMWPHMAEIGGGGDTEAKSPVLTVAETAITDLEIPSWAKEIIGFKQMIVPDLMTEKEPVVGFVRYRSSVKDWEPQEWLFAAAFGAALGTPVGRGAEAQIAPKMAAHMPLSGRNETITPNVVLVAAITTGHGVQSTVYYR